MISKFERSNWTVTFVWVSAHAVILRNELTDQLAETVARDENMTTSFSRITLSTLSRELQEESKIKFQIKLGGKPKGSSNKTILPKQHRQTEIENFHILKVHSYDFRTR